MSAASARAAAMDVVDKYAGRVSTHWGECWSVHPGCLAALIVRHLDEGKVEQ